MEDEEKSRLGIKIVILGAIFAVLLAAIGVLIYLNIGTFFYFTFNDAKNIQPGDPVILRGIAIGEIRSVKLEKGGKIVVAAWVKKKFLPYLTSPSTAIIVSQSLPNVSGRKYLEWKVLNESSTQPLPPGSVIEGSEGIISYKLKKARFTLKPIKEKLGDVYANVLEEVSKLKNSFSELKNDFEFQEIVKQINEFYSTIKERGAEKITDSRERLKTFKERFQSQSKKWDNLGKKRIAEKLRDIADYLDKSDIEKTESPTK